MYYVLQVGAGKEKKTEQIIRNMVEAALFSACFHPLRHEKKKIHGRWTHVYSALIPGYVFLQTDDIEALYGALRHVPAFLKLLGTVNPEGNCVFCHLPAEEEAWLKQIAGIAFDAQQSEMSPVVELSQVGFTVNDKVRILSGPLLNFAGRVRRIDLHRRYAEVEVEFMQQKSTLRLGIEIVEKVYSEAEQKDALEKANCFFA